MTRVSVRRKGTKNTRYVSWSLTTGHSNTDSTVPSIVCLNIQVLGPKVRAVSISTSYQKARQSSLADRVVVLFLTQTISYS